MTFKCSDYPRYYKKWGWCKKVKEFSYRIPLESVKGISNFNKVFKDGGYIVHGQFKTLDYPVGNWFYYDSRDRVVKEEVYKGARVADEFIYGYNNNGNKIYESHYVYSFNMGKAQKRLRIKSEYSYNHDIKKAGLLCWAFI